MYVLFTFIYDLSIKKCLFLLVTNSCNDHKQAITKHQNKKLEIHTRLKVEIENKKAVPKNQ